MGTPSKLKTTLGMLVWFGFAAALISKRPEYWDAWMGMGLAFVLTILTCGVAILLSGQYKQDKGK